MTWVPDPAACGTAPWSNDHSHSCCDNKPRTHHFSDCIKITVTLAVTTNHTHPTSVTASRSLSLLLWQQTTHTPLDWLHRPTAVTLCCVLCTACNHWTRFMTFYNLKQIEAKSSCAKSPRELISTRKTSHKHNNKDSSRVTFSRMYP